MHFPLAGCFYIFPQPGKLNDPTPVWGEVSTLGGPLGKLEDVSIRPLSLLVGAKTLTCPALPSPRGGLQLACRAAPSVLSPLLPRGDSHGFSPLYSWDISSVGFSNSWHMKSSSSGLPAGFCTVPHQTTTIPK